MTEMATDVTTGVTYLEWLASEGCEEAVDLDFDMSAEEVGQCFAYLSQLVMEGLQLVVNGGSIEQATAAYRNRIVADYDEQRIEGMEPLDDELLDMYCQMFQEALNQQYELYKQAEQQIQSAHDAGREYGIEEAVDLARNFFGVDLDSNPSADELRRVEQVIRSTSPQLDEKTIKIVMRAITSKAA